MEGKSQRFQYPLIKEFSLNHVRDPTITEGIFRAWGVEGTGPLRFGMKSLTARFDFSTFGVWRALGLGLGCKVIRVPLIMGSIRAP